MAMRLRLAHELDAAWIIALWKAIHGGDPGPIEADVRSVELVTELTNHLGRTIGHGAQPLTLERFESRLGELGIHMDREAEEPRLEQGASQSVERRPYCFVFSGVRYCIYFPKVLFDVD